MERLDIITQTNSSGFHVFFEGILPLRNWKR